MSASAIVPEGYKQTEIGVIPKDWSVKKISQIAPLQRGFDLPNNKLEKGHSPVVYSNGIMNYHSISMVKSPGVVTGRSGTLGVVHYIEQDFWPHNTTLWVTNFNNNSQIFVYFLYDFIGFKRFGSGSGVPTLNRNDAHDFLVAIPENFAEQKSIARVLTDSDFQIQFLENLVSKKRYIKQGTMHEILTGKTRLPGFTDEWQSKLLGDSATLKARIGWQGLTTAEYMENGEYLLVGGTEFNQGFIDWSLCHHVEKIRYDQDRNIQLRNDDVLVTKDGTIGKVALVKDAPKPATLNSGVFVIRPKQNSFNSVFFYYLLLSRVFEEFLDRLVAGSTINHLYQKDFVDFEFDLPPTIKEQEAIAEVLSDMDAEIAALEERLEKAKAIKQGMMQQLLTGKIRLVD